MFDYFVNSLDCFYFAEIFKSGGNTTIRLKKHERFKKCILLGKGV